MNMKDAIEELDDVYAYTCRVLEENKDIENCDEDDARLFDAVERMRLCISEACHIAHGLMMGGGDL